MCETTPNENQTAIVYDEKTLQMLEQVINDAFAGKTKTYTIKELMEDMAARRNKNKG
jgi:hypothetical protein